MAKKIITTFFDLLLLIFTVTTVLIAVRFAWIHFYKSAFPVKYETAVLTQSEIAGISPELLFAVIRTESGFDPLAESYVPARGLMQITQETFEWIKYRIKDGDHVTYDDMFDPETNIRYGAQLLRILDDEFDSIEATLCAYHMGRSTVKGWIDVKGWVPKPASSNASEFTEIPSSTARHYVSKVSYMQEIYNKLYNF